MDDISVPPSNSARNRHAAWLRLFMVMAIAATAWRCGGSGGSGSSSSGSTSPTSPTGTASTCSVRSLSPGASVTGSFGPDDSKDCDGPSKGDQYSLAVTGETDLELVLTPSGFPGALSVYTSSGRTVLVDSGSGVRRGKVYLPAGEYRVVVGRTNSAAGSYTLASTSTTNSPCSASNNGAGPVLYWNGIAPGAVISGALDSNDCGPDFNKNDIYFLTTVAGETVNLTLTASQDATLQVRQDVAGSPIAAEGRATRNVPKTFTLASLPAGRFAITVMALGSPVPITYTLGVAN